MSYIFFIVLYKKNTEPLTNNDKLINFSDCMETILI